MVLGVSSVAAGTAMIGGGLDAAAGGLAVSATGVGALVGAPAAVAGAATTASGAAIAAAGTYMAAQGADNASKGYERGSRTKSPNQLNADIKKGKAPKDIIRVDKGKNYKEKDHVHFSDGSALNKDGTWKHGERKLKTEEINFLKGYGWNLY